MIILLLFSFLALACGPLLFRIVHQRPRAMVGADAFVLVAVVGLVIVHVLPQSIAMAGWTALAAAVFGFILTSILEHWLDHHQHHSPDEVCEPQPARRFGFGLPLAIAALGLHAILDGTTFAEQGHLGEAGVLLGWAVILHRLPIGFAVWWWLRPLYGAAGAWAVLIMVALCTALGMVWGGQLTTMGAGITLNALQAAVAGSLLHVVMHRSPAHQALLATSTSRSISNQAMRSASVWGGLIALALIALITVIPHGDHLHSATAHDHVDPHAAVLPLWVPWLGMAAVALCVAHLVVAFAAPRFLQHSKRPSLRLWSLWWHAGDMPRDASMRYPWWLRAGCSLTALIIAACLISPIFAGALLLGHVLLSAIVLLWQREAWQSIPESPRRFALPNTPAPTQLLPQLKTCLHQQWTALRDETDTHAPWATLALVIMWCLSTMAIPATEGELAHWPWLNIAWPWDIVVALALSAALYWRSVPATLLVAMLIAHGLSWGAAFTFLWAGPLLHHHAWRAARVQWAWRNATLAYALMLGMIAALATVMAGTLGSVFPFAFTDAATIPTGVLSLALVMLSALYGASVWRQGVRQFISRIVPRHADDRHAIPEVDQHVACGACNETQI